MAKIILVDKDDEVIGLKERGTEGGEEIHRISALWLVNSRGEVLLAQRSWNKKNSPGTWGPAAAGTLEEGETYESNMLKEAAEEIGLANFKYQAGPKVLAIEKDQNRYCQWFLAKVDKGIYGFVLQEEEVAQIAWRDKEGVIADIKAYPENYTQSLVQAIDELIEFE